VLQDVAYFWKDIPTERPYCAHQYVLGVETISNLWAWFGPAVMTVGVDGVDVLLCGRVMDQL